MDLKAVLFTFSVLLTVSWAIPTGGDKEPPKATSTKNATEQPPPPPEPQGDKFNEFDWRLCKALGETERGNIVVSPISLKLVLAMIFEGADGKTAEELASALGLSRENMGRQLTRKKFSSIVNNLKSSAGEYDLNLGTSIFVDKSVTPKPAYVRKLQSFYDAQIEQVDFGQTEEAVKAINAWAAAATKGHIKNLLSNADASSSTVLMLLNAIYFKGTWMYTFPLNQTAPSTFYADGKTAVSANFMNSATYLSYLDAPEINSQIVRLPYVGKKFAMYIIVPNNNTGLPTLIRQINPFVLKKHTQNMYETLVELSLPTFKIDYMANLGSILQELGMKKLFSMDAELNDIAEVVNNSIYVSNVLQKAGIEVNEEGSTAFAATEAQVANKFGDSPVIKLKVDHPFLFFIKDEETDTVLFVGSLVNPNSDKSAKPDSTTLSPPVTEKGQPTAPTKPETTTPKPENTTNKGVVHNSTTQQSPSEDNLDNKFGIGNSNHYKLNNERFNFFDSELFKELVSRNDGNVVISSASIKTVLSMILEGSQGKTYNELIMLMRLPSNHTTVQTVLHDFQASLRNSNNMVTMKSASKIFISQDLSSDPRYKKLLQDYYHADIDHTNFATPEITAYNINNWVKSHTQGLISNLIDAASIHPDSRLILANAIFFKGEWESEFPPSNTIVDCFYPTPDECKKAYMMTSVGVFNYTSYTVLDAQAIQLPYQGGKYSMIILLPTRKDAIFNLNKDLAHRSLKDIVNSMDEKEIVVKLPRFTIEFKTDIVDILQHLGAQDMFSDNANMPGIITGGKRAKVNAFVHSAKIEVNEKGTKAGAATAGSVVPLSGYIPQFTADHPFFFYIYDVKKNVIIFSGKLSSPDEVTADSNQLVQVETLSAQVPPRERPTITSHEPQSRPYPNSGSGQITYHRGSINQQGERYGNNNDKPIRFP